MQWQHIPIAKATAWYEDAQSAAVVSEASTGLFEVASAAPELAYVEPMTRRRLSPLARAVLHCAGRCQTHDGDLKVVAASRHGEVARTLTQLETLAAGGELSPTAFSLSVHNAAAGLLSIIRRNRAPMSAVAAGAETFGWGLLDAYAAFVSSGQPVLYLYADDALPEVLAEFGDLRDDTGDRSKDDARDGLVAIGILIAVDAPHALAIRTDAAAPPADTRSLPSRFMESGARGRWPGHRTTWEWQWDTASQAQHAH